MEAPKLKETAPCRCGGRVKVFGPCDFAPRSNWVIYCDNESCQHMVSANSIEDAIDHWNRDCELVHD